MGSGSKVSSYTALAGFDTNGSSDGDGQRCAVDPLLVEKIELQAQIQTEVEKIMAHNAYLFVRPCKLSKEEEVKIFGRCMVSTSEVLSQRGKRLALIGRTRYWRSFCNIDEPPEGTETDSYEFVNENGDCLFRCSMHTNKMKIEMGTVPLGQLILEDYVSLDCREWDVGAMIVEDRNSEQVYRYEKVKRHFDVLLYPEQTQICTLTTIHDAHRFPVMNSFKPVFEIPLPDELTLRKRALLFSSSVYIFEKYYQKDRKCRFMAIIIITASTIAILTLIVLIKIDFFNANDTDS